MLTVKTANMRLMGLRHVVLGLTGRANSISVENLISPISTCGSGVIVLDDNASIAGGRTGTGVYVGSGVMKNVGGNGVGVVNAVRVAVGGRVDVGVIGAICAVRESP